MSKIVSQSHYHTSLKNGLRVITVPMPATKAVTVLVVVKTGSRNETKLTNGVSHFLEHLVFKGTKHWPNAKVLSEAIDRIGGEHNAFTDREITGYWIKVPKGYLDLALHLVGDMFAHALILPRELERERNVILEELNMNRDNPQRSVWDLFGEVLWGDQPAGWPIGGSIESVKSISRKDVMRYWKAHYVTSSTIICVTGDVQPRTVNGLVAQHFRVIPNHAPPSREALSEIQKKPEIGFEKKATDQTHFVLGARAFSVHDRRRFSLALLASLLGGMMSSRLFMRIRERKGLAYYIRTVADTDQESGFLATAVGVANAKLEEAISEILKEYRLLTKHAIKTQELKKGKEHLKGQLVLGLETTDTFAYFFSEQEAIAGNILTVEEQMRRIDAVTADDIQKLARFLFLPDRMSLAAVGPALNHSRITALLRGA